MIRKERSERSKVWLIIFFPVTLYLFIGTLVLLFLSKIERLSQLLGNYSEFPYLDDFKSNEYWKVDIWLTILFPLIAPFIAVWVSIIFIYALIAAILHFIKDVIVFIWNIITAILEAIWDLIVAVVTTVWERSNRRRDAYLHSEIGKILIATHVRCSHIGMNNISINLFIRRNNNRTKTSSFTITSMTSFLTFKRKTSFEENTSMNRGYTWHGLE